MRRTVVRDMCIFIIDTELLVTGIVVFTKYTIHIITHNVSNNDNLLDLELKSFDCKWNGRNWCEKCPDILILSTSVFLFLKPLKCNIKLLANYLQNGKKCPKS